MIAARLCAAARRATYASYADCSSASTRALVASSSSSARRRRASAARRSPVPRFNRGSVMVTAPHDRRSFLARVAEGGGRIRPTERPRDVDLGLRFAHFGIQRAEVRPGGEDVAPSWSAGTSGRERVAYPASAAGTISPLARETEQALQQGHGDGLVGRQGDPGGPAARARTSRRGSRPARRRRRAARRTRATRSSSSAAPSLAAADAAALPGPGRFIELRIPPRRGAAASYRPTRRSPARRGLRGANAAVRVCRRARRSARRRDSRSVRDERSGALTPERRRPKNASSEGLSRRSAGGDQPAARFVHPGVARRGWHPRPRGRGDKRPSSVSSDGTVSVVAARTAAASTYISTLHSLLSSRSPSREGRAGARAGSEAGRGARWCGKDPGARHRGRGHPQEAERILGGRRRARSPSRPLQQ